MNNISIPYDTQFLFSCMALFLFGTAALFTASTFRGEQLFNNAFYFIQKHLALSIFGLLCAAIAAKIKLLLYERFIVWFVLITILLLCMTFIDGIGVSYLGARRWIRIAGLTFQPSELAKITIVMYLALALSRKKENIKDPWNAFLPPLVIVLLVVFLIYLQNDFSTALFLLCLAIVMFFLGGIPIRYFIAFAIVVIPIGLLLLLSRVHRVERIIAFIFPGNDPQGSGYQVLASRNALHAGGLWGSGIGQSAAKLGVLPEAHSDFAFAILAEEFGLFGALITVALFLSFFFRGVKISLRAKNEFYSLLALGLTVSITMQALINIAVTTGILPPTGIPLPFFSTGGSSLLITLIMCGIITNISRRTDAGVRHV